MSSISNSLGQALAPLASTATQGSGTATRDGSAGTSLSANRQAALVSQTAAVVTLSSNSKARAASSGSGRQTDAAFEKQETEAKRSERKHQDGDGGEQRTPGSLNVAA